MVIKILGSGGGEGFPAPFCSCAHCESARKTGGKSLRTLSQTIINNDLLIDFPADTNAHCVRFGVNLGQLQNVLITHSHGDHYRPQLLDYRGGIYAHDLRYETIRFYGPTDLKGICDNADIRDTFRENVQFIVLEDKKPTTIGPYTVTALAAQHAPERGSLNYIIEENGKSLLYLLDSGYPTEETLTYLESRRTPLDCVILDGTMGVAPPATFLYHMGFEENKRLRQELIHRGAATENTQFIVSHITHNQAETHEKIEEIFAGTGIEIAYDGMELSV